MKFNIKHIAAAVALSGLVALGVVGSASAAEPIDRYAKPAGPLPVNIQGWQVKDGTLFAADMNPDLVKWFTSGPYDNTVDTNTVKDGSLAEKDLNATGRAKLALGKGSVVNIVPPKVIENIGGPFADRKTLIGKFDLEAGTWLLTTAGKITRTEAALAGEASTRPMIALRYDESAANVWGEDAGTIGGADIGPVKNADLFGSALQTVTLTNTTTIMVYGFGYADDQGSAASGKITAAANTTATKIG